MGQTRGVAPSATGEAPVEGQAIDDGDSSDQSDLSQDEIFGILSNQRRRYAIHHLHQNGDRADLGELAEKIAAWENDIDVNAVSSDERKRVYTSLQQFHLPKLDEQGILEFDDREGLVELNSIADDVDVYLEVVEGRDVPWSHYYLVLAMVNLAVLTAAYAGTYPLRAIPMADWGIFVAVTFLVSAIAHTYVSRTEMRLGDTETPPEVGE